jgi:hypothetical protein
MASHLSPSKVSLHGSGACRHSTYCATRDAWPAARSRPAGGSYRSPSGYFISSDRLTEIGDNRDLGDFGGTSGWRRFSTGETETHRRDKRLIVTRCANLGFNEKSRGDEPRLCALTGGSSYFRSGGSKLCWPNPVRKSETCKQRHREYYPDRGYERNGKTYLWGLICGRA